MLATTTEEWVEKLHRLMTDSQLRKQMGAKRKRKGHQGVFPGGNRKAIGMYTEAMLGA